MSRPRHRYPVEVISHCVWLYFRFPLPFREVEELMLERGGDRWHLVAVFIKINGEQKYLWRSVDQNGNVLDISCRASGTRPRPGASCAV